ncbi:MAG: gamma-glutamyl carboxylase [Myxococcaceae bacterium]|nr:gamma-glutamyl carboxylase [Myxococcaceae bacterium]
MTESVAATSLWTRLGASLAQPQDLAWLAAFRVLFGLTLCVSMLRFLGYGWVDEFFLKPRFHFKYWGFSWVEPLASGPLHALFWVLAALALMVAVGAAFRLSALLLVLGFTYLQLLDVTTYLNHYYLASLLGFLLFCSPAHRLASVDAWLRPGLRRAHAARGVQLLFRFQVAVVYTFAGLAKAHVDWLVHAQPLRIWLGSHTDLPLLGPLFAYELTAVAMSWGGFLFDTTVPWFLLWRRTRPHAYVALVGFHLTVGALFPIGMFPLIMMLAATVFFDADWPRPLLARLRLPWRASERASTECATATRSLHPALLGLAAVHCLVQLALPLRSLAYGGNVRWHEQGMRFSWRVMVREKNGSVTYVVHSQALDRTWYVSPSRYLTAHQEREISGQPDLILQLAHHVRGDFDRRGLGPVEVRVEARVSLNGRPSVLLIDPRVDLTTVRDGVTHASWILPAPDEAPPHTRPI